MSSLTDHRKRRYDHKNDYDRSKQDNHGRDYYKDTHRSDRCHLSRHKSDNGRRKRSRSRSERKRYESYHRSDSSYDDILSLDEWPRKLKDWDMCPMGFEGMTVDQVKGTGLFIPPSCQPKVTNLTPFVGPNRVSSMLPGSDSIYSGLPYVSQSVLQKKSRHINVSGFPPDTTDQELFNLFNDLMNTYNFSTGPEPPVKSVVIDADMHVASIELGTSEEATSSVTFNGMLFRNEYVLKVEKSKGMVVDTENFIVTNKGNISTCVSDSPDKIFICCIPPLLNEIDVVDIFQSFGTLKSFHLVKEPNGTSKGFAFCEYQDPEITEIACIGLNQFDVLGRRLVVQKAGGRFSSLDKSSGGGDSSVYSLSMLPNLFENAKDEPSTVIQLMNIVTTEELIDDEEHKDILDDIRLECEKYGKIIDIYMPRPTQDEPMLPAIGRVFIQYEMEYQAKSAMKNLSGMSFSDRTVLTSYFPLSSFVKREF